MNKNGRPSAYSIFTFALVCVLLLIANGLALFLGEAFSLEADLSHGRLYTLSEDTKDILSDITKDISVYTLYSENSGDEAVTALFFIANASFYGCPCSKLRSIGKHCCNGTYKTCGSFFIRHPGKTLY